MDEKVAQESPGSNSLCSPPKNSVAPTTAMLQKSAPSSPLQYFETMFEGLTSIPPLDAKRFNGSFEHFRSLKHPASDQDSLYVGGKKVNLHSLHVKFMSNRGYETKEQGPRFWSEISEKLGLIDTQDESPASSEIVDELAKVYKEHLEQFDSIYVTSFKEEVEYRRGKGLRSIG